MLGIKILLLIDKENTDKLKRKLTNRSSFNGDTNNKLTANSSTIELNKLIL